MHQPARQRHIAAEQRRQLRAQRHARRTRQRGHVDQKVGIVIHCKRQRIGKGDGYDSAIARGNLETLRDSVETLTLSRGQALRALEVLVGRYPAADVEIATQLAQPPGPVPAGLPPGRCTCRRGRVRRRSCARH